MSTDIPPLRRTLSIVPSTIDDHMMKVGLDMSSKSNSDIVNTTNLLSRGKFRHPRARQLQAAVKYGCYISPEEAFHTERWLDRLYHFQMLQENFPPSSQPPSPPSSPTPPPPSPSLPLKELTVFERMHACYDKLSTTVGADNRFRLIDELFDYIFNKAMKEVKGRKKLWRTILNKIDEFCNDEQLPRYMRDKFETYKALANKKAGSKLLTHVTNSHTINIIY